MINNQTKIHKEVPTDLATLGSISYMLNGTFEDHQSGSNAGVAQNHLGNIKCYDFDYEDYRGSFSEANWIYLFLANQIVRINTINCSSEVLIKDTCFTLEGNVTGVVKQYDCGQRLYFGSKCDPLRYLDIGSCFEKEKLNTCQDCNEELGDIDCNQFLINKPIDFDCLSLSATTLGQVPGGVYQVAVAYTDKGVRVSDYYIYPNTLKIYNRENNKFSININFKDCHNPYYDEYEVVLISSTIDRSYLPLKIGIFDYSVRDITITDLDSPNYLPLSTERLMTERPYLDYPKEIVTNTESLLLVEPKEGIPRFDYREQAQNLNVTWTVTSVKPENAKNFPTFMRGEVYALWISFFYKGKLSHSTHIPNLQGTFPSGVTKDTIASENDYTVDLCNPNPKKYWEVYDTSKVLSENNETCVDCEGVITMEGEFGYWESGLNYKEDYPNLSCSPIRYHKFPDNCTTHIHTNTVGNEQECVNILGIKVGNVTLPLDGKGNVIPVDSYVIQVSDRTNHKSILHKGLIFNTRNIIKDCETIQYPNYPYNDLRADDFLKLGKDRQGIGTSARHTSYNIDKYTYHSPDNAYRKPEVGQTLKLYTEQVGKVQGLYHPTKDYPKYQALSPFGRFVAQAAGLIEGYIAVRGEKCTTTEVTKIYKKVVDRTTKVEGFPTPNMKGQPITGGGGVLAQGTGTLNPVTGGSISTSVTKTDYEYTTEGDKDCNGLTYRVTLVSFTDSTTLANPLGANSTDGCILKVRTTAPENVGMKFTYNEEEFSGITDEDGDVYIDLKENCPQYNVVVNGVTLKTALISHLMTGNYTFNPECDYEGDTEERVTTIEKNCTSRNDYMRRLNDKFGIDLGLDLPVGMTFYTQGLQSVTNLLKSFIRPRNYAIQYTSQAEFTSYNCTNIVPGNTQRTINLQRKLEPIRVNINGDKINNHNREVSEYLELNLGLTVPSVEDNTRVLHGDINCGENVEDCKSSEFNYFKEDKEGNVITASSYYAGVLDYKPNQYGDLGNHIIKQVSCPQKDFIKSQVIYGGDVYITKMQVKRKMPFFKTLPLGMNDNTNFNISDFINIEHPTFWMDVNNASILEDLFQDAFPVVGNLLYDYNLEQVEKLGECYTSLGKLFAEMSDYPILTFPTTLLAWATELIAGNWFNPFELQGLFYTHVTGISSFYAESEYISDFRFTNELPTSEFYPNIDLEDLACAKDLATQEIFLYPQHMNTKPMSKAGFVKVEDSCINRIYYSLKTQEETKNDNWKVFLPLNYQNLPSNSGTLTSVFEVDDYNLMIAFEDGMYITQQDEGLLTDNQSRIYLGTNNAYQRRLRNLSSSKDGWGGCIDKDSIVTTKFGVFWIDRKRKKFISYGETTTDLTGDWQTWFNHYLSFNDNSKDEITGVYDSHTDMLFYTNRVKEWTFGYSLRTKKFTYFYSFVPRDYLAIPNNFVSIKEGVNSGLWIHNQFNKYTNYYGKQEPFVLEIVIPTELMLSQLQWLMSVTEFRDYKNYDEFELLDTFYDTMTIHNQLGSTGIISLVYNKRNSLLKTQEGLYTKNCNIFTLNDFKFLEEGKGPYFSQEANGMLQDFSRPVEPKIISGNVKGTYFKVRFTTEKQFKVIQFLLKGAFQNLIN